MFSKQTDGHSVTWMPLRLKGHFSVVVTESTDETVHFPTSLLYVELLAPDSAPVWETGQRLADGPELLLPFLELPTMLKVCGSRQGESIPDANHKGKQDQRHDLLVPSEEKRGERSGCQRNYVKAAFCSNSNHQTSRNNDHIS